MRKEIASNRDAWSRLSEDHYKTFREALDKDSIVFNSYIEQELDDLAGKRVIHLQCNTGADTIVLAKRAAYAVGVDLVPDNIHYAKKLAAELGVANTDFLVSDVLEFGNTHSDQYDVVFVSEGAICWLPDLAQWARTVRSLLKDDGYFYIFDAHPFYMALDEEGFAEGQTTIKYPYFSGEPVIEETIGGYASDLKDGVQAYSWCYTVADLINSLTDAGLHIQYFHEFPELFYNAGGMQREEERGLYRYPHNPDRVPMSFSIKASVYR